MLAKHFISGQTTLKDAKVARLGFNNFRIAVNGAVVNGVRDLKYLHFWMHLIMTDERFLLLILSFRSEESPNN